MKHHILMAAFIVALGWSCRIAGSSPVRILPMGDSITHGYFTGVTFYNSYRKELKTLLETHGYDTDFVGSMSNGDFVDNQHEGHDGWHADETGTTNDILGQVAGWLAATPADIVLLHIGTNDILGHDESAEEVSAILDEIFGANSNATVVLALIINAAPAAGISADISTYNSNLNAMAQLRITNGDDIIVVDMEQGAGLDYASADIIGAHPSQAGYDKMATNWYPAVTEAIVRQQTHLAPHIASISVSKNAVVLDIGNLTVGETVDIEQSSSLLTTNWIPVEPITPTNDSATWTQIIEETNNASFFRLVQP